MDTDRLQRINTLLEELYRLVNDEPEPDKPKNVTPIKPDEVELTGILGRPNLKLANGKQLFTAGLGVKEEDGLHWYDMQGWGKTAEYAARFARGERVTVTGTLKRNSYLTQDGVMAEREVLRISSIHVNAAVGSVVSQ